MEQNGEVAAVLAAAGASLRAKNNDGKTPMDLAPPPLQSRIQQAKTGDLDE